MVSTGRFHIASRPIFKEKTLTSMYSIFVISKTEHNYKHLTLKYIKTERKSKSLTLFITNITIIRITKNMTN